MIDGSSIRTSSLSTLYNSNNFFKKHYKLNILLKSPKFTAWRFKNSFNHTSTIHAFDIFSNMHNAITLNTIMTFKTTL